MNEYVVNVGQRVREYKHSATDTDTEVTDTIRPLLNVESSSAKVTAGALRSMADELDPPGKTY